MWQPDGYQYTQFLRHFRAWQQASRPPVMRQVHRAGETLEVDYAGMTLMVSDHGVPREAQVFVAALPCSQLIYAEATWSQGHEDWLSAHVRALSFIGGCPEKLVPDNTKTGVTTASYYDPVLNRSYHELARHYGIAVVPARVRRPRDKSSVENAVKQVERWVLAPLRHRRFLSLAEVNAAVADRVEAFNNRPFSPPREGSRRSLFEAIERTALKRLPAEPFVIGQWLTARVNIDYMSLSIDISTRSRIGWCTPRSMCSSRPRPSAYSPTANGLPATCAVSFRRCIPRFPSICLRRTRRWRGARRSGCARMPLRSASPLLPTSTACCARANTPSRASGPVLASCDWPGATGGSGSNSPASAPWPRALYRRATSSSC